MKPITAADIRRYTGPGPDNVITHDEAAQIANNLMVQWYATAEAVAFVAALAGLAAVLTAFAFGVEIGQSRIQKADTGARIYCLATERARRAA